MSDKIRIKRRSGYSAIPNALIVDTAISPEARLMLMYIMSCAETWTFYRSKSQEVLGCGKDKYQRIIRELKTAGYLIVRPKQDENGRLVGQEWEVIDDPKAQDAVGGPGSFPKDVVSDAGHREPENPAHGESGHREPEKPASRENPPAGKSGPLRNNNKQEEQLSSCAASAAQDLDIDLTPESGDSRVSISDTGNAGEASPTPLSGDGWGANSDTGMAEDKNPTPNSGVGSVDFDQLFAEFETVYPRMGDREATEDALRAAIEGGTEPAQILAGARAYAREQEGNAARFIAYSENWLAKRRWAQHSTSTTPRPSDEDILRAKAQPIIKGQEFLCTSISDADARRMVQLEIVTVAQCAAVGIKL